MLAILVYGTGTSKRPCNTKRKNLGLAATSWRWKTRSFCRGTNCGPSVSLSSSARSIWPSLRWVSDQRLSYLAARASSPPQQADKKAQEARGAGALKRARKQKALSIWYQEARNFGRIVSERGGSLAPEGNVRQNVIATGGGPGIMEAANRGADDAGAPSIGFNIVLPTEQEPNGFSTPNLTFRFHYVAVRKMHFAMRANALAIFPGGLGTMDELFEILTLKQTRKSAPMPIILFSRSYWRKVVNFDALADLGMIDPEEFG